MSCAIRQWSEIAESDFAVSPSRNRLKVLDSIQHRVWKILTNGGAFWTIANSGTSQDAWLARFAR